MIRALLVNSAPHDTYEPWFGERETILSATKEPVATRTMNEILTRTAAVRVCVREYRDSGPQMERKTIHKRTAFFCPVVNRNDSVVCMRASGYVQANAFQPHSNVAPSEC